MRTISIRIGLWMLAGFISFFLLMYVLGLAHHSELRVFNGIIHLFCLYQAIQAYFALHPENIENYVDGVAQGMGASAIGVGGFAVFMTLFFAVNPAFLESVRQSDKVGEYMTFFTAPFFIVVEGIVVSIIGSYIITRIVGVKMDKT